MKSMDCLVPKNLCLGDGIVVGSECERTGRLLRSIAPSKNEGDKKESLPYRVSVSCTLRHPGWNCYGYIFTYSRLESNQSGLSVYAHFA